VIAIVQARMGSTRLPQKVMMRINGKPLIGYLLERLATVMDRVVVACPAEDRDSELGKWLLPELDKVNLSYATAFVTHDTDDLAARFAAVLDDHPCEHFIRICADSPLLDPALVARAADPAIQPEADYLWIGARLPHGQQVERFRTSTFLAKMDKFNKTEREHIGLLFRAILLVQ